jgi:methyltransferase
MYFWIFLAFLITQRLSELYIARQNEKWLLQQGAVQYGQNHYPFMVGMHTLFIVSMIVEYIVRDNTPFNYYFLLAFILVLSFKFWALSSLGKYWNTKIYRVPGVYPVNKGPYKIFKHPNYMEVILEIAIIPLVFNLYYTAIIFSVLNAMMLYVRISVENKVWADKG